LQTAVTEEREQAGKQADADICLDKGAEE